MQTVMGWFPSPVIPLVGVAAFFLKMREKKGLVSLELATDVEK
jgi:hypothetical protein